MVGFKGGLRRLSGSMIVLASGWFWRRGLREIVKVGLVCIGRPWNCFGLVTYGGFCCEGRSASAERGLR